MKDGENVISDKAEKEFGLNYIKEKQSQNYVSQETTVGVAIDECPMLPLGNQILIEYNLIHEKAGIKLVDPIVKYKYPKVIGHGKLVKSVNIGDHIILKNISNSIQTEVIDGFMFHVVYETSLLGIYKGSNPEERPITVENKPSIIV